MICTSRMVDVGIGLIGMSFDFEARTRYESYNTHKRKMSLGEYLIIPVSFHHFLLRNFWGHPVRIAKR